MDPASPLEGVGSVLVVQELAGLQDRLQQDVLCCVEHLQNDVWNFIRKVLQQEQEAVLSTHIENTVPASA